MSRFTELTDADGDPVQVDLAMVAAYQPCGDQTLLYLPGGALTVDATLEEVANAIEGKRETQPQTLREERRRYEPFDEPDDSSKTSLILSMTRTMGGLPRP